MQLKKLDDTLLRIGLPQKRVLASVLSVASLSVFSNYYFSIVNIAEPVYYQFIAKHYNKSINYSSEMLDHDIEDESANSTIDMNTSMNDHALLFAFIVISYNIGSLVGCLFVPFMAETLGRKGSLMLWCNLLNIGADILMALSWVGEFTSLPMLIIGRFGSGMATGMVYILLPVYLTEISSQRYRGFNASCDSLMLSSNTLFSFVIGLPNILGRREYWVPLHLMGVPFAIIQILTMTILPESPKYLLINRKNEILARRSLEFFQPHITDQEVVIAFMHYKCEKLQQLSAGDKVTIKDVFTDAIIRRPIFIGCLVVIASISTGIVAIFTYSTTIFLDLGIGSTNSDCKSNVTKNIDESACEESKLKASQIASIILSICNTAGALLASALIDRVGRRPQLLICLFACSIFLTLFMIIDVIDLKSSHAWLSYMAVVVICAHVFVFNVGPGAIMWFICSEMTPQAARSLGTMLTMVTNTTGLIILNFIFPPLEASFHGWVLMVFIVPNIVCTTLLYFEMPETKNREVSDILRNWNEYTPRGWKLLKQRAKYAETLRRHAKARDTFSFDS